MEVRLSALSKFINACLRADQVPYVISPPGCAKTAIVSQVASDLNLPLFTLHAATIDPVDILGLPTVGNNVTSWNNRPSILPPADTPCLLFLDEAAQGPIMVQNVLAPLVNERRAGPHRLHPKSRVVLASNREQDQCGTTRSPRQLLNRCIHAEVTINSEDWFDWAMADDDSGKPRIAPEVTSFIRFKPSALYENADTKARAFPSLRTWHMLSDLIRANPDQSLWSMLACGAVGDGAGSEFMGYIRVYRDLPSTADIFANPESAPVPEEPSARFALLGSLASQVTTKTMDALLTYLDRIPGDFQVLAMKDVARRDIKLLRACPRALKWYGENRDLLNEVK